MAKYFSLKLANMAKPQEFVLYPYSGGDEIWLQSDKRMAVFNLRTGEGVINAKNRNFAGFIHTQIEPLKAQLPEDVKIEIQSFLWKNDGKDGNVNGVVFYENNQLFSSVK